MNPIIHRFKILDSLRGIAAILVFMYHMKGVTFLTNNKFINSSGIFVDLFFILSGFVIYHNYKKRIKTYTEAKTFFIKRFKRLYPLHFYTLVIIILIEFVKLITYNFLPYDKAPFYGNSISTIFTNLFLLNSTPLFQGFLWNGQSWSISAELFCYLLFIIVSIFFFKNRKNTLVTTLTIIILSYLFFFFKYDNFAIIRYYEYSFVRAFIGFFLGVGVYLLREKTQISPKENRFFLASLMELSLIVLIVYLTSLYSILRNHYYIYHLVFSIIILTFSYEKGMISYLFSKRVFQNLGLWSYSIYLNHMATILIFEMIYIKLLKLEGFLLILSELTLIIFTCIYSKYTYKYIEKRFYKKLNVTHK